MTLKKVVITGLGIVSSIGVGVDAVLKSLKEGKSGIKKISGLRGQTNAFTGGWFS